MKDPCTTLGCCLILTKKKYIANLFSQLRLKLLTTLRMDPFWYRELITPIF